MFKYRHIEIWAFWDTSKIKAIFKDILILSLQLTKPVIQVILSIENRLI